MDAGGVCSAEKEAVFGASNYDPIPVVLSRGGGCILFDTDGKPRIDMM